MHLLEEQSAFLKNFISVVDQSPSEYEAVATFIRQYPDYYQREFILLCDVANFMRERRPPDNKTFRNIYAVRSNVEEQRWNGVYRKVL